MSMTIDEFCQKLAGHAENVPIDRLVELMTEVDIDLDLVAPHVSFCDEHYQRNLLSVGTGYSALILCWKPGQASPIHDHHGSACGVRVLQGTLGETKYTRDADGTLTEASVNRYECGHVCGSYDADVHVIRNEQTTNLVTLHVYTPPMREYHTYSLDGPEIETHWDHETMAALGETVSE